MNGLVLLNYHVYFASLNCLFDFKVIGYFVFIMYVLLAKRSLETAWNCMILHFLVVVAFSIYESSANLSFLSFTIEYLLPAFSSFCFFLHRWFSLLRYIFFFFFFGDPKNGDWKLLNPLELFFFFSVCLQSLIIRFLFYFVLFFNIEINFNVTYRCPFRFFNLQLLFVLYW